jgi:AcrR family transcriptional regulator
VDAAGARKVGRPRDPLVEGRLLRVTQELIAEIGIDALTMNRVAERAGASKATIFRRWDDKRSLVRDAVAAFDVDTTIPNTGALRSDLEELVRTWVSPIGYPPAEFRHVIAAISRDPDIWRAYDAATHTERTRSLTVVVRRAVARGEAPALRYDAAFVTRAVHALATEHAAERELPLDESFVARVIDSVVEPIIGVGRDPEADAADVAAGIPLHVRR